MKEFKQKQKSILKLQGELSEKTNFYQPLICVKFCVTVEPKQNYGNHWHIGDWSWFMNELSSKSRIDKLSLWGQIINLLGFAGHNFCHGCSTLPCSTKVATGSKKQPHVSVLIKLYLQALTFEFHIRGWSKSSFKFFRTILQKNPNKFPK